MQAEGHRVLRFKSGLSARAARAGCAKSNLAARLEQAEGHLMALLRGREGSIGEVVEAKLALAQAEFERLRVQARGPDPALSREALLRPRQL
jgi:DNA-binding response OmpR family regulator